jgi:hypothetical protein
MTKAFSRILLVAALPALLAVGCKKEEEQAPANTSGMQQTNQQPTQYQQPAAQTQYQTQPAAQPAAAQPAAVAQPAAAAGSPTPAAYALACKQDGDCVGARCNLQAGKCQIPCGSNTDCQAGWACMTTPLGAACMPSGATAGTAQ